MATVIAFANTKGGVGKTTLSGNVAWALAELHSDDKVLYLDADPQASGTDWFDMAPDDEQPPFTRGQLNTPQGLNTQVRRLRDGYDWIVIDCPPMQGAVSKAALLQSDLGVLPVQPSPLDMLAYTKLVPVIEDVRAMRPELPLRYVVNQLSSGTVLGDAVRGSLAETEIEILKTTIHDRQAYRRVVSGGGSVVQRKGAARDEVLLLARELVKLTKRGD